MTPWIVCQLGAREHYALARALGAQGIAVSLCTDVWVPPQHPLSRLKKMRDRHDAALAREQVVDDTWATVLKELNFRYRRVSGWSQIIERNESFQKFAARSLERLAKRYSSSKNAPVVFAYSYAAKEVLRRARAFGWKTLLGQIDPGPQHFDVARKLREQQGRTWSVSEPPSLYWENWREECSLADAVVVNSQWSLDSLATEGVLRDKLHLVPLAITDGTTKTPKSYPRSFSGDRKLRVLFLGQLAPMKGLMEVLEAANLLADSPVEFCFVGPKVSSTPMNLKLDSNARYVGAVARSEVKSWYEWADVFIFPTHSDGFGLTQLEAAVQGVPIIASRRCGDVVEHEKSGLLIDEVSAIAISGALQRCLAEPQVLSVWATNSRNITRRFSEAQLADNFLKVARSLV
jgi:glycosyltransferase involved in cell wall biosynthesis